jgi:hypothetical protein
MDFFRLFRRKPRIPQLSPAEARAAAAADAQPLSLPDLRATQPASLPPAEVRRLMFDAVAALDDKKLETLCREHQALILEHAASWFDAPPEIRSRPDLYHWYHNGLHAISRFCAEKLGRTELLDRAVGVPETAPAPAAGSGTTD